MRSLLSMLLLMFLAAPTFAQNTVEATIDFEGFAAGAVVSTLDAHGDGVDVGPILVHGSRPSLPDLNTALIFDSSNPPGIDFDLGTPNYRFGGPGDGPAGTDFGENPNMVPLFNVLIFAEDLHDGDNDGLVDIPNDADEMGMVFEFDFSSIDMPFATNGVTVHSLTALDIETEQDETPATIHLFDADDVLIAQYTIGHIGCNGVKVIPTGDEGTAGVYRMEVRMEGSGAIDNIEISATEAEEECVPCEGGITQLELVYNGDVERNVRIKRGWTTIFCDTVAPGDTIVLDGSGYCGVLGSEIKIYLGWCYHARLGTDCYSGTGIGSVAGDFEVIGGTSKAGALCDEVEEEHDGCWKRSWKKKGKHKRKWGKKRRHSHGWW